MVISRVWRVPLNLQCFCTEVLGTGILFDVFVQKIDATKQVSVSVIQNLIAVLAIEHNSVYRASFF